MNILSEIKESVKYVSDNSKYVNINYDRLEEISKILCDKNERHWLLYNEKVLNMNIREIINFIFILHFSGLYCFWGEPKWQIEKNGEILDGSVALISLILDNYEEIIKNKDISFEQFSEILKAKTEIPFLKERYFAVKEGLEYIKSNNIDFYDFSNQITNDLDLINLILHNFTTFKDESLYKGKRIKYYKRAQLLVSDILHIYEQKENKKVDYSNLVGCADYKIPQVLREFGVLEYSEKLGGLIDNKIELEKDSEYENEIRANMLVVIQHIAHKCNLSAITVNDQIWMKGQEKNLTKPYHRTKTTAY